jgi:hypothetical protein
VTIVLRSCGVCGGHWSGYRLGPDLPGGGWMWLCSRHREAESARWAAWNPAVNDRCFQISYPEGPFSDLLVIEVNGERVATRPLGFPEREPVWHRRDELAPARY